MDKLPPWSRRFARAASAALLALILVLQLVAGAASARTAAAEIVAETGHCAAGGDGPRPARERQAPCFCCIAGRSILLDALAGLPTDASPEAIAHAPPLRIIRLDLDRPGAAASPLGWTSSWSQRAPPRPTASPLRLEG